MEIFRSFRPGWSRAIANRLFTAQALALTIGVVLSASTAQATPMTDAEEIAMGRSIAHGAVYRIGPELSPNAPASIRVKRIGERMAKLSSRQAIPYTFKVLKNSEVVNAFSIGGGPIFITSALVSFVRSDAELAAIIGHEIAHIDRRHMAKRIEQQREAMGMTRRPDRKLASTPRSELADVFGAIMQTISAIGYARQDETEADEYGVRWMSKLGYDPHANVTVFRRMRGNRELTQLERYISTHPAMEDRENHLTGLINTEHLENIAHSAGGPRLNNRAHARRPVLK